MRPSTYLLTYCILLGAVLLAPVSDFPELNGAATAAPPTGCFTVVSVEPPTRRRHGWPPEWSSPLRFKDTRWPLGRHGAAARMADTDGRAMSVWWPAGGDSVDVAAYHRPRMRLALRGGTLRGRIGTAEERPLYERLLFPWTLPGAVTAVPRRCPAP